jgi:peptidoglycan hydrolase-like protein with peptidoglycan-binding domain
VSTTDTTTAKDVAVPPAGGRGPHRPPPRRGRWGAAGLVVLVCAGAGVAILFHPWDGRSTASTYQNTTSYALEKITQGDLSSTNLQSGKLGYAGDYDVINRASGTVTGLPSAGDVIHEGKPVYRVDGAPVIFLKGSRAPVYRTLTRGLRGADVQELNAALVHLEYATKDQIDPASTYYGAQTYWAMWRFQKALGLKKTGQLPLGEAVFLPASSLRISKVDATIGGNVAPGQTIIEASSTDRQASLKLDASEQSDVKTGDKVTITMPSGATTPGVVSSVGRVATTVGDDTTVDVYVRLLKPRDTGNLDQTPVQVAIVSDTVKNVLSVPVNALLALAGGGYAVEVVNAAGTHTLVRVDVGLVDNSGGRVQISGTGLAAGQNVVVPAS